MGNVNFPYFCFFQNIPIIILCARLLAPHFACLSVCMACVICCWWWQLLVCCLGIRDFHQLVPDKTRSPPRRNILSNLTGKDPDDQIKCFSRHRVSEDDGMDVEASQISLSRSCISSDIKHGNLILAVRSFCFCLMSSDAKSILGTNSCSGTLVA